MSTSITSITKPKLAPLLCVNCNAPLVVVDAPSLVCPFCEADNVMPPVYREELRLARDLDSATGEAAERWMRLARIKAPRWWLICAAIAPFVLMTGGLTILLVVALLRVVSAPALPGLLPYVWVTLIPAQLLAANVAMKNVLVRCVFCGAESIVRLDEPAMATLRTRVASAQSSLAEAMNALTKHAKLATIETRGRTYVIAGLLVLPLIWSFIESWNSSYWGLLIALDVFVLALCVFWSVREAFLPPVTIEELDALWESSSDKRAKARAPGTRGWYDNASDKVNFLAPAFVTLIFVAIQIVVLRAKG